MINSTTPQNLLVRKLFSIVLAVSLSLLPWSYTRAQACPDLPGGTEFFRFSEPYDLTLFPSDLPVGKSGEARRTAGKLHMGETMTASYPLRTATIYPEFTDGTTGSAVLRFDRLDMASSSGVIRIYPGATATGTPTTVINSSNSSTYVLQTQVYNGPVTVTFESPTPAASGDFDIMITYTTGDKVVTSPFGFKVAYWTSLITPNSYTALDTYPETAAPIATAYFNASRQLVFSEISFCIDYGAPSPSIGNSHYPGQFVFNPALRPDLNKSGVADGVDALATARLVYVLSHLPTPISDPANFEYVQSVVDAFTRGDNANYGGLHGDAIAAIPTLPSPAEPQFSITGPATAVAPGTAHNFVVNLINDGGHPRVFKLETPAGIIVNSATGATYDPVNKTLTFAASPASATVSVTSTTSTVATIRLVYDQPGFWNVNNLIIYEPCTDFSDHQGFLGISKGTPSRPFREASADWTAALTPLACSDAYFYVDGPRLYKVDIVDGTRTAASAVQGDPNAIGYNVLDNFIWGYNRSSNQVMKLGANGSELFTIPNMPAPASATSRTVGTVDLNGYLYLYEPNATEYITIDINPARTATYLKIVDPTHSFSAKTGAPWGTITTARNISDWAYNPTTGLIHAVINKGGSDAFYISLLNPVTGVSTLSGTSVSGANITSGMTVVFDSQFFDADGNLVVLSSNWYSINLSTFTATQLSEKPYPLTSSDGASCALANAPVPFACTNLYYQVEGDKLYSFDESRTRNLVATLSGNLNAIGYSTTDNMIWGFDNAAGQVFRLGSNGVIQRFAIPNMPAATQPGGFGVGTVGTNGYLYLYEKNGLEYITIDIDPSRAETYLKIVDPTAGFAIKTVSPWGTVLSGGARDISDWAYSSADNLIYALADGSSATPYRIVQVNPLTGNTTLLAGQVTGDGLETGSQNFGSCIMDTNGNFIVFGNTTGHLYRINTSTKVATQVTTVANPSANSDGTFCLLATSTPLPVTLVSFDTYREGKTANLKWATTLEDNSKGFEIERSTNTIDWTKIGFVSAQSQGSDRTLPWYYTFTDAAPLNGPNYYRLKMIDLDATFAYSRIRAVRFEGVSAMVLYPNPVVNGKLTIGLPGDHSYTVEVINLGGVSVLQRNLGKGRELDLSGLTPGVYVLRVKSAGEAESTATFIVK